MFSLVSPSYDIINRISTFGFDQIWRKRAAKECLKNEPEQILDLCCGTGDLSVELSKKASAGAKIIALDFSENMLNIAREKVLKRGFANVDFFHADVADMPFTDNYFDAIGISFAFRNLTYHNPDSNKFLQEILRVLKTGGRFVIIETSQPENILFRKLFHIYLKLIVPALGGLISGRYKAYRYLGQSAIHYYNSEEVRRILLSAGFSSVTSKGYLSGISRIYISLKL